MGNWNEGVKLRSKIVIVGILYVVPVPCAFT